MQDMLVKLVDLPLARMFVLTGIIFLLVAVLGRVEGKIEPGNAGRVGATIIGVLLMVLGLAMYFLDGDAVRAALRDGAARSLALHASASSAKDGRQAPPADTVAAGAKTGLPIVVVAGTYGRNCGAPSGNVTAALARTCNGRSLCKVAIDAAPADGATPGCDKDYAAEWKCGSGAGVYSAAIPPGAGRGASVTLTCPG
ncbi:MAG: hypothetical protein WCA01_07800 [Burkholderiales bacterium]|jgi:hypothetical protein